ncbi:MAG TPA: hypothetical protein VIC59_07660 [Gemmatimonadota bacterium]
MEPAPTVPAAEAVPAIPGANVVTYVATDFGFEGPARIPAGLTTLRLINHGAELHHLMIVRLPAGKTSADYVKAMSGRGPEASLPEWAAPEGGPNAIVPGEESNATALLEPGTYAFTCWIPSPDGVIHGTKGMTTTVEVTPTSAKAAPPEPEGDIEVELVDYTFQVTGRVAPGPHVLAIENEGTEPHELSLWRLAPGKSLADLVAWTEAGMAGEPPGKPIGGVAPMKPGDRELFGVNLEPGEYALLCFVPDDEDGKPHIQHGMAKQFTVG